MAVVEKPVVLRRGTRANRATGELVLRVERMGRRRARKAEVRMVRPVVMPGKVAYRGGKVIAGNSSKSSSRMLGPRNAHGLVLPSHGGHGTEEVRVEVAQPCAGFPMGFDEI